MPLTGVAAANAVTVQPRRGIAALLSSTPSATLRLARPARHLNLPVPAQAQRPLAPAMDKLVQFGRKAWFVVRVLSGYEERRIRSYRLQLQKRLEQAQARNEEVRKQPEQVILSEVRQVVQQMQALNQHLEEAIITDMQMEKEETQMKEMTKVMQEQIKMQREIAMRRAEATTVEPNDTK